MAYRWTYRIEVTLVIYVLMSGSMELS